MGKYEWDINKIKDSFEDERKINALSNEINNVVDPEINNLFNRADSFKDFKRRFRIDFLTLCRIDDQMAEYIFYLYEKVNLKDLMQIELPKHEIDDEILVKNIYEFFKELNDKEILDEIEKILDPNNNYLRIIKKEENNPVSSLVRGRVIKSETSKDVYGSVYKKDTDEDIVILAHELGHMLAHRLFNDKQNIFTSCFLTEVESYYMELLAGHMIGEMYDMKKLSLCFRANRLTKIMDHAWDIHIQYIMNTYLFNVNYKSLDKELKAEGYIHDITEEDYKSYIKIPFLYRAKMINSYMVALELFKLTLQDKEKGIKTYKNLFRSDIENYQKLLNKYKLNYLNKEDNTFDYMIEETKQLKKIFTNMN